MASDRIVSLLGDQADYLLKYTCTKVRKEDLHLPSPQFVDGIPLAGPTKH